jgi:hypothetical protein
VERKQMKRKESKYTADMTAGSLLTYETRIIAGLLLDGLDFKAIKVQVEKQNILQKRSIEAAKRMFSLIKNRLEDFDTEFYKLIYYGDADTSRQAMLVGTIKNSRIMEEFVLSTVREKYLTGDKQLTKSAWNRFVDGSRLGNPDFPSWTQNTFQKIGDCIYRALNEAGYLSDTNELQAVYISREVKTYLENHNMLRLLQCLEVSL